MRILTTVVCLCFLATMFGCGEAGVGFNIGKEVPVDIPVDLPIGDPLLGSLGGDPAPISQSDNYNISEVTGDSFDEILVQGVYYSLSDVGSSEQVDLDAITIQLSGSNGSIGSIDITTPTLQDISKTTANFDHAALTTAIQSGNDVISEVTFDFGEYPSEDLNFTFTFYFDVVAKIRE